MSERVLVALSGGVDSSVAAARLVAAGHEVIGVTLHLWDYPDDGSVKGRCCAPEDVHDAQRVSDKLKIPHYAFDRRELFEQEIVGPFVESYLAGETPSPCVRCNRGVKLKELFGLADRLEASAVATGHYARIVPGDFGPRLLRARDLSKDQSYFLHMLGPETLTRLRLPLGESTKTEVRAEAMRLGLPGAEKGESQELCFVPTGRYDRFVSERAKDRARPGPIVDAEGRELGRHEGVHQFTRGQRRNVGVALGRRAYVVDIDPEQATVRLGEREELEAKGALLDEVTLAAGEHAPLRCSVSLRYRGEPQPAEVRLEGVGRARVEFDAKVNAAVPGQYAVFYRDDAVVGGGRIVEALREGAA